MAVTGLLDGKFAVITGAGRGIGKVIARMFVEQGARVLVADNSGAEEATAAALGDAAIACHTDVTCEEDIAAMFATAMSAFGKVDASIHLAGNPGSRWGEEVTVEEFDAFSTIHLRGMLMCSKHAVRAMRQGGGGSIVNFGAVAGMLHNSRNSIAYSAAKAGISSLTRSFAVEYGPQGIRANAIAPGITMSEKNRAAPASVMEEMVSKTLLGRAAQPEEQAAVAVFLASDRSSFLSGVTIPVDGGWTAQLA